MMGEPGHERRFRPGQKSGGRYTVLILVLLSAVIVISRGLSISHNIALHPDEKVFVESSMSLLKALTHANTSYEVVKPYPEGAFVLQMPFHAAQYVVSILTGIQQDPYLWGRIAGVFYFVVGWLLGSYILYSCFGKSDAVLFVYGITMCFSLFQIEQSRYGTGDPITFLLLNLTLLCSAHASARRKKLWFFLACVVAGMSGAVKYPLILISAVPLISAIPLFRSTRDGWGYIAGIALVMVGFLLLSPSVVQDPHYLHRVFESETQQYLHGGSISEVGGPGNHFLSVVIYHLLYSDFPFGLFFCVLGVVLFNRNEKEKTTACGTVFLFGKVLPSLTLLFLIYNIFVPLLYYRTLYPYFCISIFYSSYAVGSWLEDGRGKKAVALAMIALMVCRGSFLVYKMSENLPNRHLITLAETYTGNRESRVVFLEPIQLRGLYVPGNIIKPENSEIIPIDRFADRENRTTELKPGELVITANFDFGRAQKYLLPVSNTTVNQLIETWDHFKEVNRPYLKAKTYPEGIYYLFGYWLKGSSAGSLEFPENYIYYRDPEQ